MDPTKSSPAHPSEEILEEYVFHRLPEALAAPVEEHLLICQSCQDALANADRFVSDLKIAARQPALSIGQTRWGWGLAPVLALALLVLIVVRKQAEPLAAPVAVSLSSLRGLNPGAEGPAGKPLLLTFDAPDLSPGSEYRAEVVDGGGGPVWKGTVTETGGRLATTILKPLGNGSYWVRLYGANSELLREFGLSVR